MRRFLVLVSLCVLGTGISHAEIPSSPVEILSLAISQTRFCEYESKRETLDGDHNVIAARPIDKEDEGATSKLSLPIMFRPGRFRLEEREEIIDNRPTVVIRFSPLPPKLRLAARKGENKHYNKAMNSLTGRVEIDQTTGHIKSIEAWLAEHVGYDFILPNVFVLRELNFTMKQRLNGHGWEPESITLEIEGEKKILKDLHDKYTFDFLCTR
ncbi:MAG: hypothetical protein Q8P21_00660 [bacterium]|nr:hypothetical protein [bacterium]